VIVDYATLTQTGNIPNIALSHTGSWVSGRSETQEQSNYRKNILLVYKSLKKHHFILLKTKAHMISLKENNSQGHQ